MSSLLTHTMISCIAPEDEELAGQYIYEIAKDPANAYGIAMRLSCGDYHKATVMNTQWRADPHFQSALRDMQKNMTAGDRLMSKEELALAVQEKMTGLSQKLWLDAARFYADLQGYIKKDTINTNVTTNVMVVPADQDFSSWELSAVQQQQELKDAAKVIGSDESNA